MEARDLLADLKSEGLTIKAHGDQLVIHPATKLTNTMRAALRDAKPAVLTLLAEYQLSRTYEVPRPVTVALTDPDVARLTYVCARMVRWRWTEGEAESVAERLLKRDREQDNRVSCVECRHYRPGRCGRFRRAGLSASDVGHDFAGLLQHCPAYQAAAQGPQVIQFRVE